MLRFNRNFRYYFFASMKKQLQSKDDCLSLLKDLNIPYKLYEHDAVMNLEEMEQKLKLQHAPYIKNLFYTDKKPNSYFLVIVRNGTKLDKGFWKKLGTTNNNVRMAKDQVIQSVLKSSKGSINPFALTNDQKQEVKVALDDHLYECEYWAFHPLVNTATVELKRDDFIKFLDQYKIKYQRLSLDTPVEQEGKQKAQQKEKQKEKEDVNIMGIVNKKNHNFSDWYQQVIVKSGLIEYYDVSGCYILRPWAFSIWEKIQAFFDDLIKKNGVQNAYFPLFVSKKALETEKEHVQGFAPQVAWVTKYGTSDLSQPIAIRPTSETIMYPAYAKWIKSHRDLPLKLNQWTNVVRWEFKHPTPFIRTRQFLWQEGHTAHATKKESDVQTYDNLEFYRKVYEQLLAVPVRKGIKTQSQKFAGGDFTTTVETWIYENGRAIQAATSHNLGQNFSKMFQIQFLNESQQNVYAWQTSWGLTTRSIGIMTMYHGDDKGLVLPPLVAATQVVIIPIPYKQKEQLILKHARQIYQIIKASNIRVQIDDGTTNTPGWKFNNWELRGVPIRLQVGPKDMEADQARCVLRVNNKKFQLKREGIVYELTKILAQIQDLMFKSAKERMVQRQKAANNWKDFMGHLNNRNVVLTPWCDKKQCQAAVKEKSGIETKKQAEQGQINLTGQAKTLCIPLDAQPIKEGDVCFACGAPAKVRVLWGRSY